MIESNYRHLDGLTLDPTNRVPLIVPTATTPQPRPSTQNEPVMSPTLPQVEIVVHVILYWINLADSIWFKKPLITAKGYIFHCNIVRISIQQCTSGLVL